MQEVIAYFTDLGPGNTTWIDEIVLATFFITFCVVYLTAPRKER